VSIAQAPAASASDPFLLRGLESGDARAAEDLVARHADSLYGFLRMVLPSADEAEQALVETMQLAVERAAEPPVRADAERWLKAIAVETVAARLGPGRPISLAEVRRTRIDEPAGEVPAIDSDVLAGVTDSALATLVRTLPLRPRQALVLRYLGELDEAQAARILGCDRSEVARLIGRAMTGIGERLGKHEAMEEELRRQLSDANPYHLRPIGDFGPIGGRKADFHTSVDGTRVRIDRPPPTSLFEAIRNAMRTIVQLIRRAERDHNLHDDVGTSGTRTSAPEATPTQRPIEKPKRTPSLTDYRTPKLTPGVAVYAMPRGTAGTGRVSNPRRPMPVQSWSSASQRAGR
jgi:DNA-directed RNA polymerase specialized sigma24 family protein